MTTAGPRGGPEGAWYHPKSPAGEVPNQNGSACGRARSTSASPDDGDWNGAVERLDGAAGRALFRAERPEPDPAVPAGGQVEIGVLRLPSRHIDGNGLGHTVGRQFKPAAVGFCRREAGDQPEV